MGGGGADTAARDGLKGTGPRVTALSRPPRPRPARTAVGPSCCPWLEAKCPRESTLVSRRGSPLPKTLPGAQPFLLSRGPLTAWAHGPLLPSVAGCRWGPRAQPLSSRSWAVRGWLPPAGLISSLSPLRTQCTTSAGPSSCLVSPTSTPRAASSR